MRKHLQIERSYLKYEIARSAIFDKINLEHVVLGNAAKDTESSVVFDLDLSVRIGQMVNQSVMDYLCNSDSLSLYIKSVAIGNFEDDDVVAFLDGKLFELRRRAGRAEVLSAVLQEKFEAINLDQSRLEYLADAMRISVVSVNNYVQELLSDISKMNGGSG